MLSLTSERLARFGLGLVMWWWRLRNRRPRSRLTEHSDFFGKQSYLVLEFHDFLLLIAQRFVKTLQQFIFDLFLFHVHYTPVQYAGLAYLFALYAFQGLKFLFFDLPKERERDELKKSQLEQIDQEIKKVFEYQA